MNTALLIHDLQELSLVCSVLVPRKLSFIVIEDVCLPPGWNRSRTRMRIDIPEDYRLSPPGVGDSSIYLDSGLRYLGRIPNDYHEGHGVGGERLAWWCYQSMAWDPRRDNLITLLERVRADLSSPEM